MSSDDLGSEPSLLGARTASAPVRLRRERVIRSSALPTEARYSLVRHGPLAHRSRPVAPATRWARGVDAVLVAAAIGCPLPAGRPSPLFGWSAAARGDDHDADIARETMAPIVAPGLRF